MRTSTYTVSNSLRCLGAGGLLNPCYTHRTVRRGLRPVLSTCVSMLVFENLAQGTY